MIQFRFREQATQQITLFTSRKLSTNSYSFRAMLNDEKVSEVLGFASELAAAALFDMRKTRKMINGLITKLTNKKCVLNSSSMALPLFASSNLEYTQLNRICSVA